MDNSDLVQAIIDGSMDETPALAQELLDAGTAPREIMEKSLIAAMEIVGDKFEAKEYFVPEVLVSAQAMKAALAILEPLLADSGEKPLGKIVIGTVKGDLHDIGKNIVAMMLQGAGFQVINLGADVSTEGFAEAVLEHQPQILGMSSLLTTAMINMQGTIDILKERGIRDSVKIMVGGAAITPEFAKRIGADQYGDDANIAVRMAREWMQ